MILAIERLAESTEIASRLGSAKADAESQQIS